MEKIEQNFDITYQMLMTCYNDLFAWLTENEHNKMSLPDELEKILFCRENYYKIIFELGEAYKSIYGIPNKTTLTNISKEHYYNLFKLYIAGNNCFGNLMHHILDSRDLTHNHEYHIMQSCFANQIKLFQISYFHLLEEIGIDFEKLIY